MPFSFCPSLFFYTNMTKRRQSALIDSSACLATEKTLYNNTIEKAVLEKLRKEVNMSKETIGQNFFFT